MIPQNLILSWLQGDVKFLNVSQQVRIKLLNAQRGAPLEVDNEITNCCLEIVMYMIGDGEHVNKRNTIPIVNPKIDRFPIPNEPRRVILNERNLIFDTTPYG